MIPVQTACAIGIMPSLIDHCVPFPSVCPSAVELLRKGGRKKKQLDNSLTPHALCPVPLRQGPRSLATCSWLFAAPTILWFTPLYSCMLASDLFISFVSCFSGTFIFSKIPRARHPTTLHWKPQDFPVFLLFNLSTFYPQHQVAPTTTSLYGFYFYEICFILIKEAEMVVGGGRAVLPPSPPECLRLP